MGGRPIVFLSDFGLDDEFVGVCHGVIAKIAPEARVIDLTHGVPPQDVVRGANLLADAVPSMPEDAVYLAVVDPGVGSARRAIAVESSAGPHLVGPDNGILSPAWGALGGAARAVELPVDVSASRTFHGRDVFAPAAAHLALGQPIGELGADVDPSTLTILDLPEPEVQEGRIRTVVSAIDRFGNVQLNARPADLRAADLNGVDWLRVGTDRARRVTTFAEAGRDELAILVDSTGRLAVIRNDGRAAESLGVRLWDVLTVEAGTPSREANA